MRFGAIADIQYADIDSRGSRFYRNSLPKLDTAISYFNTSDVSFVVNLGDVIDCDYSSFDAVMSILKKSQKKLHNTTGNHDYPEGIANETIFKRLNMPAEYYQFKYKGWKFIMLNTNEVASYANIKDTWKAAELEKLLAVSKEEKRGNAASYNGGISSKQMLWLEKLLKKSQKKNEPVILLSHHPLAFAKGFSVLNDKEIQSLIRKYSCVKAVFSGHHHSGDFGILDGVPYITLEGMVETKSENSYGIVELYTDKILINGQGRMISRKLEMRR